MLKIKSGDLVEIWKGRDAATRKRGRVRKILSEEGRAVVAEVNVMKKHVKPGQRARQAGIIEIEAPVQLANLRLVCSKCDKATRAGFRFLQDGSKARYCKKCGELT